MNSYSLMHSIVCQSYKYIRNRAANTHPFSKKKDNNYRYFKLSLSKFLTKNEKN